MTSSNLKRKIAYPTALLIGLAGWWFLEPSHELSGADQRGDGSILSVEENTDTARRLNRRQADLRARIDYKESLMVGFVGGEYTLKQVAREFARVNADDETTLHMMRCGYPGETDEEKAAHNVLDFLKARQLPEAELAAILQRGRTQLDSAFPR